MGPVTNIVKLSPYPDWHSLCYQTLFLCQVALSYIHFHAKTLELLLMPDSSTSFKAGVRVLSMRLKESRQFMLSGLIRSWWKSSVENKWNVDNLRRLLVRKDTLFHVHESMHSKIEWFVPKGPLADSDGFIKISRVYVIRMMLWDWMRGNRNSQAM